MFRFLTQTNFNTSKVRLEGEKMWCARPRAQLFQYLKGAIGSLQVESDRLDFLTFQYLKGAIGSRRPDRRNRGSSCDFNTSKVRLEVARLSGLRVSLRPHFNTSKVRLEVSHRPGSEERRGRNFNTSKVRLEEVVFRSHFPRIKGFQYLKGAIGSRAPQS